MKGLADLECASRNPQQSNPVRGSSVMHTPGIPTDSMCSAVNPFLKDLKGCLQLTSARRSIGSTPGSVSSPNFVLRKASGTMKFTTASFDQGR